MMDKELYVLLKNVYLLTGWNTNNYISPFSGRIKEEGKSLFTGDETVYYTSDYLLEKLGEDLEMKHFGKLYLFIKWLNDGSDTSVQQESDTPLKALLKLTIALHEAGEL